MGCWDGDRIVGGGMGGLGLGFRGLVVVLGYVGGRALHNGGWDYWDDLQFCVR
jgi:hypothetical protein